MGGASAIRTGGGGRKLNLYRIIAKYFFSDFHDLAEVAADNEEEARKMGENLFSKLARLEIKKIESTEERNPGGPRVLLIKQNL